MRVGGRGGLRHRESGCASPEAIPKAALESSRMPLPVRHEGLEVEQCILLAGVLPPPSERSQVRLNVCKIIYGVTAFHLWAPVFGIELRSCVISAKPWKNGFEGSSFRCVTEGWDDPAMPTHPSLCRILQFTARDRPKDFPVCGAHSPLQVEFTPNRAMAVKPPRGLTTSQDVGSRFQLQPDWRSGEET